MNCLPRIALALVIGLVACTPASASAATPIGAVDFKLADHDALFNALGDGCVMTIPLGWREDSDGTYFTPAPNDASGSWGPDARSGTVIASGDLLQLEPYPPGGHARPVELSGWSAVCRRPRVLDGVRAPGTAAYLFRRRAATAADRANCPSEIHGRAREGPAGTACPELVSVRHRGRGPDDAGVSRRRSTGSAVTRSGGPVRSRSGSGRDSASASSARHSCQVRRLATRRAGTSPASGSCEARTPSR